MSVMVALNAALGMAASACAFVLCTNGGDVHDVSLLRIEDKSIQEARLDMLK